MSNSSFSYLALGDSYTIGEQVAHEENFPNQLVSLLNISGIATSPARIIAKTGWTTDELAAGIKKADDENPSNKNYDLVSLLIGVNNQYRGRSVENYKTEFGTLVYSAIEFANGQQERVIILSIPDWGVTPFAADRDRAQIAKEIDEYNAANKNFAESLHINYFDITPWTREAAVDLSLLTSDGLHPSGKEYKRWASTIAKYVIDKR